MIMIVTGGDSTKTVLSMRPSAGSGDRCVFSLGRVARVTTNFSCPAFSEGQGQRLAELLGFFLQTLDALGCEFETSQQRGLGGALPIGDLPGRRGGASSGSKSFDLGA